jgi:hypothetical protein
MSRREEEELAKKVVLVSDCLGDYEDHMKRNCIEVPEGFSLTDLCLADKDLHDTVIGASLKRPYHCFAISVSIKDLPEIAATATEQQRLSLLALVECYRAFFKTLAGEGERKRPLIIIGVGHQEAKANERLLVCSIKFNKLLREMCAEHKWEYMDDWAIPAATDRRIYMTRLLCKKIGKVCS